MFYFILTLLVCFLSYYLYSKYTFFSKRNVSQKWPKVPLLGHIAPVLFRRKAMAHVMIDAYNEFPEKRYSGIYQFVSPFLLIRDPELIKQIAVKDFDHFMDHQPLVPEDVEPMWGKNLFSLTGDRWKKMRVTLSPTFTSSKMKSMFHLMNNCGSTFVNYFEQHPSETRYVDMKDILRRFANDVIGSVVFGVECDSLKNRDNEFFVTGNKATNFDGFLKLLSFSFIFLFPNWSKLFNIRIFSEKVTKFFTSVVKDSIKYRDVNNIVRPDLLHFLLQIQKNKEQDKLAAVDSNATNSTDTGEEYWRKVENKTLLQLTDDDIIAQTMLFFLGGYENIASTLNYLSYEVAVNPEVQEKLQREIDQVLEANDGQLNYEALTKMKYLDMVLSETLRKWPTFDSLDRICVKDYTIQPKNPGELPVHLKKDDAVVFPIFPMHFDEQYFTNPDKFDPERFNDQNRHKISPYVYMPFGVGPRNCIGSRFALLETKILTFHLLSKFNLVVNDKTPIPLRLASGTFAISVSEKVVLDMEPRVK